MECGILVTTPYNPDIHGDNNLDIEPGDEWFVFSPEFLKDA